MLVEGVACCVEGECWRGVFGDLARRDPLLELPILDQWETLRLRSLGLRLVEREIDDMAVTMRFRTVYCPARVETCFKIDERVVSVLYV